MNIADQPSDSNRRRPVVWVLSAVVGLAVLILIAMKTGIDQFLDNLRSVQPWVLLPLIVVYSISWLFRGLRLKQVLHLAGVRTGLFKSMGIELLADLPNQFVPAKLGDSVKVVYLHKTGLMDFRKGTFTAFLVRVMDLAAVILMAMVSALFVSGRVASGQAFYLVAISVIMLLLLLSVWVFIFRPALFCRLLIGPLKGFRDSAMELSGQMRAAPARLLWIFTVSVLVWLFDILTLLIFLLVLGVNIPFAGIAFVMLLSTTAKIVPLTPNGLGVYEGMMVILLTGFGVDGSTAFTVAVLDHGFMNVFSLILSLAAVYMLGLGFRGTRNLIRKNESSE